MLASHGTQCLNNQTKIYFNLFAMKDLTPEAIAEAKQKFDKYDKVTFISKILPFGQFE